MDQKIHLLNKQAEVLLEEFNNPTDKELGNLLTENAKLKYRLKHLKNTLNNEITKSIETLKDHSKILSPKKLLIIGFRVAIFRINPSINHEPLIDYAKDQNKFDYQCNSAFKLSKLLNQKPPEVAKLLLENLPSELTNLLESTEAAKNGFISLSFKTNFYIKRALTAMTSNLKPQKISKKKLIIDYSAPNIAKDMHVGHLRSTIIGDSIANFFEYLGYDILRLNHIGDWGTQFGMLIAHLQDIYPNYSTQTPDIQDLEAFYKASKKLFDEDADFKVRAYDNVVKLQAYEPTIYKAWNAIVEASRVNYSSVYKDLNISKKLIDRGESFYNERMNNLMKSLLADKKLTNDEGRYIYFPKDAELPLTLIKSDGGFTYDSSDLACIKQRIEEEKADIILYVTDKGQSVHFDTIFKAAKELDIIKDDNIRIEHVPFGVVLGKDKKKFKTRSGETIKLRSLLDEGRKRTEEIMVKNQKVYDDVSKEEFDYVRNAIAMSSIKYADLCTNRENDYIFNFDKMLSFNGNTGAYLMYMLTRIKSIFKKANITQEQVKTTWHNTVNLNCTHPEERKLIRKVVQWYDKIILVENQLYPHIMCEWLYELSRCFSEFYDKHYIMDCVDGVKILNKDRLLLCEIVAVAMEKVFEILGFLSVDKM